MSDPATLGIQAIKEAKNRYLKGEEPYISISVPSLYSQGFYPEFDLIKEYEKEVDITIVFPHYAEADEREVYKSLALELSKKHKILLHEASIEAGGGADTDTVQQAVFVYQQFQPVFAIIGELAVGIVSAYIYDILKKLYINPNNSVVKNQYTIVRSANGITYHYVFDNLTADEAITAGKLIPNQELKKVESYHDIYLHYDLKKNSWVEF